MSLPSDPLPIDEIIPALRSALSSGTRAVLVAPPGAGKTTRVPLALLDADWRGESKIVMLEPRRLAARAAARRMALGLGEAVGETVGYRVRLDTKISAKTCIEVVTEGVFTRMILADPELKSIAAVLFDEFHERSLDGDLGLALALDASALREDLRILVMSATLDGAKAKLFEAKRNLLAYDDTVFYQKLVSGEATVTHAWDGWCNYGIAENPAIKYVIPKEGSDLWVDTMVVASASKNKDAAHKFIDYVLNADNG
jgi:hypothetical protein